MHLRATAAALAGLILSASFVSGAELVVAAAASLREPVETLARNFEEQHPGVRVLISLGASSSLARQIRSGAPAMVFLSADERWVSDLVERGLVAPSDHFPLAGNRLVVIARPKLGVRIESGRDLLNPLLERIALPSAAVPLGRYARSWLARQKILASIEPRLITTEHAKASLVAVEHRHVDAALVYASDTRYAERSEIIFRIPESEQPDIVYSAALVREGRASPHARDFYRMLAGAEAARLLESAGFTALDGREAKTLE
jgi:molybdate transport system substrate-binding protein